MTDAPHALAELDMPVAFVLSVSWVHTPCAPVEEVFVGCTHGNGCVRGVLGKGWTDERAQCGGWFPGRVLRVPQVENSWAGHTSSRK